MDSRVDPTTTLGEENLPVVGSHSVSMSVTNELRLVKREVLKKKSCEVSIFSKVEQVLHVQGVDAILGIILNHLVSNEERLMCVWSSKTVEGETTRKTGHGTEETLERLGHVMRNEVLVDLRIVCKH